MEEAPGPGLKVNMNDILVDIKELGRWIK